PRGGPAAHDLVADAAALEVAVAAAADRRARRVIGRGQDPEALARRIAARAPAIATRRAALHPRAAETKRLVRAAARALATTRSHVRKTPARAPCLARGTPVRPEIARE